MLQKHAPHLLMYRLAMHYFFGASLLGNEATLLHEHLTTLIITHKDTVNTQSVFIVELLTGIE